MKVFVNYATMNILSILNGVVMGELHSRTADIDDVSSKIFDDSEDVVSAIQLDTKVETMNHCAMCERLAAELTCAWKAEEKLDDPSIEKLFHFMANDKEPFRESLLDIGIRVSTIEATIVKAQKKCPDTFPPTMHVRSFTDHVFGMNQDITTRPVHFKTVQLRDKEGTFKTAMEEMLDIA